MVKLTLLLSLFLVSVPAHAQFYNSETGRKAGQKIVSGDRAGAIAVLDEAIANGKDLNDAYQMRANLRAGFGDIRGSVSDLSSAIQLKPNDPQLYKRRAMFRLFLRDSNGALADYDFAIANGLKSDEVYTGRAKVKADIGDTDGAVADYRTALAVNPNYASAHVGLAQLFEKKGDLDNAILELQTFVESYESKRDGALPKPNLGTPTGEGVIVKREGREPDGSQVLIAGVGVTTTFKADTPEEYEKAVRSREQMVNVSLAFFTLGRLYGKKDDVPHALASLDKGLNMVPTDAYGRQLRGEFRIKKGDLAGAIEDYKIAANPAMISPNVHSNKCILLTLQGDDAGAEKEMDAYLQVFPDGRAGLEKRIAEAKKLRSQQ